MWRKTTEARPEPAASKTPAPASVKSQETSQTVPQQSSTPASSTTVAAPIATSALTTAPAPAASRPVQPLVASVPASSTPLTATSEGNSTISAGLKIKGEITGASDLTIDGETHGKVRIANGRVTIGPNGRVFADIDAREIVVFGTVQGNLIATESVRLGASSQVEGSVLTPRIGIDDGASLHGNVEMARPGEASRAPAQTQSAHASQSLPKQTAHTSQPTRSPESAARAESPAPATHKPDVAKAVSAGTASTAVSADE